MTTNTLGIKIKELRKKRNLTQSELAKLIGCAQNTIAEWESTRERLPGKKFLLDVSRVFDVPVDYLLNEKTREQKGILCCGEISNGKIANWGRESYYLELAISGNVDNKYALKVKDDSMFPIASNGDHCIFEEKQQEDNDIVVVHFLKDKSNTIKIWKEAEDIGVLTNVNIKNNTPIILVEKNNDSCEYKIKNKDTKVNVKGVLIAVKKSIKIIEEYPKIRYVL